LFSLVRAVAVLMPPFPGRLGDPDSAELGRLAADEIDMDMDGLILERGAFMGVPPPV
jgi:hypothetical protein